MSLSFNPAELKEIKGLLARIGALKAPEVLMAFRRAALLVENRVKLNTTKGGVLNSRTGKLRSSIGSVVREQDGKLAAHIGSGQRTGKPVVYANILEKGGIIRPVNRQWLTIPTQYAKSRAGAGNMRAREVSNGFFQRTKEGTLILYQGGKTKPVPMFVLKKHVTIPAKRYLSLSLEQSQQAVFEELKNALGKLAEG